MANTIDKRTTGLYNKFRVERTDGKSERGEKHDNCEYFVLDLDHDKHSVKALKAYAKSCRKEFPKLAEDLERKVLLLTSTFFGGPHSRSAR